MHKFIRKLISPFLFLLAVPFISFMGAQPAMAHNSQETSSPADGSSLTEAPLQWVLQFTKTVPLDSATAEVINSDGVRSDLGAPRHGDADSIIVFDLPSGLTGSISSRWRLVGVDGHIISGRVNYSVQAVVPVVTTIPVVVIPSTQPEIAATTVPEAQSPTGPVAETEDSVPPITTATLEAPTFDEPISVPESVRFSLRLLNYLGIILVGGILFGEIFLASGTLTLVRARQLAQVGLVAVVGAPLFQLMIFSNDIRRTNASWLDGFGDAFSTTAGSMLLVKLILGALFALVLLPVLRLSQIQLPTQRLLTAIAGLYLLALAYGGHSRSQSIPWLGVPADIVHTAATALWVGGLMVMYAVIIPNVDVKLSIEAFRRFGYVAERAVLAIVVTGVIQSIRLHQSLSTLFTSTHGILLLIKVVFFIIMLRLASRNRQSLLRRTADVTAGAEKLRRILMRSTLQEFVVGMMILGVTAAMVSSVLT